MKRSTVKDRQKAYPRPKNTGNSSVTIKLLGARGAGKTTLLENVVNPALEGAGLALHKSATDENSVRVTLTSEDIERLQKSAEFGATLPGTRPADIIGLRVHVLKEKLETFGELFRGNRNIEGRRNDRDFRDGDYLLIREYDDIRNTYSGRREIRRIGAIRRDFELGGAIAEGFVLLHLEYVELGVREVIDGHYDVVFAA